MLSYEEKRTAHSARRFKKSPDIPEDPSLHPITIGSGRQKNIKNEPYFEKKLLSKTSNSSTLSATAVSWFCTLFSVLNTAVA